jgi:hypothetical protein
MQQAYAGRADTFRDGARFTPRVDYEARPSSSFQRLANFAAESADHSVAL